MDFLVNEGSATGTTALTICKTDTKCKIVKKIRLIKSNRMKEMRVKLTVSEDGIVGNFNGFIDINVIHDDQWTLAYVRK